MLTACIPPMMGQQIQSLTADRIVQRLVEKNRERAALLQHYTGKRRYHVEYHGFPKLQASMEVEAIFDAPSARSFHIVSESGSKLLIEQVLEKLLESEKEAGQQPDRNALTPANYSFTFIDTESTPEGQFYVLRVEPRIDSKYLYRGKIWVESNEFAVAKIEAEPARNPSFWIKKTDILHVYSKVGDFWFPRQNRSQSKIRLGGLATLTIDYTSYKPEATALERQVPMPSVSALAQSSPR